jgi:hypothetical protein
MIPLPEQTVAPFKAVRHAESPLEISIWSGFFQGHPLRLEANTTHRIEVEYEVHSTALIQLKMQAQRVPGANVKITYTECYAAERGDNGYLTKGDRTKREGHALRGPSDYYECNQREGVEIYEPFWWRTFRFLVLEFTVGDEPLDLIGFAATQTNYPMAVTAEWNEKSNPEAATMWDISVRTMRNCMFDGYSDCPFYEQLQ